MDRKQSPHALSDSLKDFRVSWQLLKQNYKAFLSTELFAIAIFLITIIIAGGLFRLLVYLLPSISLEDVTNQFSELFYISRIFRILVGLISSMLLYGFLNCTYGLAYNIMSSGDLFAEFKGAFFYFRNHWWKYFLFTIILFFIGGISPSRLLREIRGFSPLNIVDLLFLVLDMGIFFFWFLLLISCFPSISRHGRLKYAVIEDIHIIKNGFKRLFHTWGLFFLIFVLPIILLSFGGIWIFLMLHNPILLIVTIIFAFCYLLFFGFPLMSLLATGLYNNIDFERYIPPKTRDKPNETELL